jgi:dCMP deaminase
VQCARKIVQVGIKEVVYSLSYGMDHLTQQMFDEAGVRMRQWKEIENIVWN